jgi:hypothetical protein
MPLIKLEPEKLETDDDEGGVSYFCQITTSHIAAHTWELRRAIMLDVFSCKPFDTSVVFRVLDQYLNFDHYVVHVVDRGISAATMHFFGAGSDGSRYYFPYADGDGKVIAAKSRAVETKEFSIVGDWKHATLFGQNKFTPGGKAITITEGEFDTLACYQLTGSRFPVVRSDQPHSPDLGGYDGSPRRGQDPLGALGQMVRALMLVLIAFSLIALIPPILMKWGPF